MMYFCPYAMILSVVFFLIIFSLDHQATAYNDLQYCNSDSNKCPFDSRTSKAFECKTVGRNEVIKDYRAVFPGVNTLQLSGSYRCNDPEDCIICDCNEGTVPPGYSGFTGRNCETKFEICPDGQQVCFHGAHCLQVADNNEYICACAYLDAPLTFMGEHCEYEATEICGSASNSGGRMYCTNNGVCNNDSSNDVSCQCKEGFFGLHCEFITKPECDLDCKNGSYCNRGVEFTYSDDDLGFFELVIKIYQDGKLTPSLDKLNVGDSIEARGPLGMIN